MIYYYYTLYFIVVFMEVIMEDFEEDSDPGRLYYEQKAMEQDPDYVNWLVELAKQEELDKYSGIYECF